MDSKITLSFDKDIIEQAKTFAASQDISLSRLTEFLYRQITSGQYKDLEELPVADWVNMIAEGDVEYKSKQSSRKSLKHEFLSKKRRSSKS